MEEVEEVEEVEELEEVEKLEEINKRGCNLTVLNVVLRSPPVPRE